MKARDYYEQAHSEVGTGVQPHVEDSGPSGRVCFRLGTHQTRSDVVCEYPQVYGSLDFWAVASPIVGATDVQVYIGEDVNSVRFPDFRPNNPDTLPVYAHMKSYLDAEYKSLVPPVDWAIWNTNRIRNYRIYPPRVRCSRLAFLGGLGYGAGETTLPPTEHPSSGAPHPSGDKFLGWYGYDSSHRSDGLVNQYWEDDDPGAPVFTQEGWGRPAFDFTPIAAHADQDWAYAPATASRDRDTRPLYGSTDIQTGEWGNWTDQHGGIFPVPSRDIYITNWWLLGMIGGDKNHGNRNPGQRPHVPTGKAFPLYWNPELIMHLTFFGESGTPDMTQELYLTILRRIYAAHCKTTQIDPSFSGIPFPPGFLCDVRIMAETWECRCAEPLISTSQLNKQNVHVFSETEDEYPTCRVYLGTHFSVLYKCPFPLWRRGAA